MSVDGQQNVAASSSLPAAGAQDLDGPRSAAAGGTFTCNVNRTGPAEDGTIYIHLREVNGQFDRWYAATSTVKKEMLATALTAISSGLKVVAFITTTDEYGTLKRLYVTR